MQSRVAIISLIVAIVLGLLTAIAYRTPRGSGNAALTSLQDDQSTSSPLTKLDPITVSKIEVIDSSGTVVRTIEQNELGWVTTSENGVKWPVDPGQPRGLARLISDATKQPVVDAEQPENATTLKLTSGSGSPIEVAVSPTSLGGSTLIFERTSDGRTVARKASGDWNALLSKPSLDAWRTRRPLAVQADSTTALSIKSGARELSLVRAEGAWRMNAPKTVFADPDAANKLIEGLAAITAERFVESGSSLAAIERSFENPVASVQTSTSMLGANRTNNIKQVLDVGGPADASGSQFFARVTATSVFGTETVWGPVTVVLTRQAIESLVQDPSGYVSKRSVQVPSADIKAIRIASSEDERRLPGIVLDRNVSGWTISGSSPDVSERTTPLGARHAGLSQLAALLCDTPASAVVIDPKSIDPKLNLTYEQFGDLELFTDSGIVYRDMAIGQVTTAAGKTLLVVKDTKSEIWRVYEGAAEPDRLIAPIAAALHPLIKK